MNDDVWEFWEQDVQPSRTTRALAQIMANCAAMDRLCPLTDDEEEDQS